MPEITNNSKIDIDSRSFDDADKKTMIRINNVSMTFNMASEQLNNLKEYFLAIVKHKLFFEELRALNNINFEIKQGDVFGIVGTNGSGKSTLLKIVAGVLEPSEGSVEINGSIAPLIELGAGFDMELSARENIYLNGALLGHSKAFIDEHFDEIVEFSEVEKFLDMPMKNYSSGMIARIAFAIATVIVPEILIVDEVLSVGDFMFQKKCEDKITELIKEHNTTVLIVSHSNDQIRRLCNKAIWIEKGKTRMLGSADEVCGIYGLVGGRQGEVEAESTIIKAATEIKVDDPLSETFFVQGSTAAESSLSLAKHCPKRDFDAVCLCSVENPVNVTTANALAGVLGAPVVAIKREGVDYQVIDWLNENKPENIYLFNTLDSPGPKELAAYNFDFAPKIEEFNYPASVFGISRGVLAQQKPILGKTKLAFLGSWHENVEPAVLLGPVSYREKIPFLLFGKGENDPQELVSACKELGIEEVVNISPWVDEEVWKPLENAGVKVTDFGDEDALHVCAELAESLSEGGCYRDNNGEVLIVPKSVSQCFSAASAGFYAANVGCPILIVDNTSLNSIADAVSFIKRHHIKRATIVEGNEALSTPIVELLSKVVKSNN